MLPVIKSFPKQNETRTAVANFQGCPHNNEPISYFCMTCGISVGQDHTAMNGHSVVRVSKSESLYLQEQNISHKSLAVNKRNLQLIETEMGLLTAGKETALRDLETFKKFAQEQLEQHISDLRNGILYSFSAQQTVLHDKQNEIQKTIKLITDNITQAGNTTETFDDSILKPICDSLKKSMKNHNQLHLIST